MAKRLRSLPHLVNFTPIDRRLRRRYSIERDVVYRVLSNQQCVETGSGKTVNVSSSGVWFTTERPLESGQAVELAVNWPALLHDVCPLKLMIYGIVIRSDEKGAALGIRRYEFRTQRTGESLPAFRSVAPVRLPVY
jgi:hypothetical protein